VVSGSAAAEPLVSFFTAPYAATFEPSADRASALDAHMRARLADSLDYIFGEAGDALDLDPAASAAVTERIRRQRQSPHMFGAYHDLVLAFERGDPDDARRFAGQLTAAPVGTGVRIGAIDDRPSHEAERCRRLFMSDPALAGPPPPALFADCEGRLDAAFALLDAGFPELAGEVRALLRDIVVAAGPEDPSAPTFDGASTYMLWGAILLNARGQTSVLDTAQALAHESGHNLLFGLCADGSLVENPDEELFASPLRIDARPMDGVVHATYVIARMHQTLTRLLAAKVLGPDEIEAAQHDLGLHRRNFEAGDAVIREGARLTDVGTAAMTAARDHMAAPAQR